MAVVTGPHSYIGSGDITANVVVGNYTSIARAVQMHPRLQHPCIANPLLVSTACLPTYPPPANDEGPITIGNDVWIGRNAVLLGKLTIGDGAIIGAYSVVAKDIPPYAVVVGNPAQIKRYRFEISPGVPDEETIAALLDLQWWNWPEEVIAERAADMHNVYALIAKYAYEIAL